MTTNSFISLTTSKPDNLIREFRKKVASNDFLFEELVIEAFLIQYIHNHLYRSYVDSLNIDPENVLAIDQIPFLPIEFFKSHSVRTGHWPSEKSFMSSGTTQSGRSKHEVDLLEFYTSHSSGLFRQTYGNPNGLSLIALLPSYQAQGDSSLIAMVDEIIHQTGSALSGYYLTRHDDIRRAIELSKVDGRTPVIIGVSFALLDLAESGNIDMAESIIIETGGMKGRRKELIRKELHEKLCSSFNVKSIHSEYGMTELLTQAYSIGDGLFSENGWLKCVIRDINDPFDYLNPGESGGVNVIDLANIHSCCFVETKDIGRKIDNDNFEILGRFDNSDIRGCNLLL